MNRNAIIFTDVKKVEYKEMPEQLPGDDEVLVKTEYTALSGGTEKACLLDAPNTPKGFPKILGYSGSGVVLDTGRNVEDFSKGDRVLVYHGYHSNYNTVTQDQLTKIEYDNIDMKQAAFVPIAAMSLGGVRKTIPEQGESGMVFGMGILGAFAVQFLKNSGVVPVIAVDLNASRRALALKIGADYAFDPTDTDFVEKVKRATDGTGAKLIIEVTGAAVAMKQALDVASWMARIALLGCTRISDCPIDYYSKVHRPGITLIGAHNFVRPKTESYPNHWTQRDDCKAILKMLSFGRISFENIIEKTEKPENSPKIYADLLNATDFPTGVVFDWKNHE